MVVFFYCLKKQKGIDQMPHPHEQFNQEPPLESVAPIGAVALHDTYHESTENPIAGDVNKFVHPDETRTDAQVAHDERVARNLHMSGDDGADDYWADYDEYFGTEDDGEEPKESQPKEEIADDNKPITIIEEHPAYRGQDSQYYVTSVSGHKHHTNSTTIQKLRDDGLTDEQIGLHLDKEESERWERIRKSKAEMYRQMEEDDYVDEDPLEGDVDRWVDPDETRD
jgi:hypothetical protein